RTIGVFQAPRLPGVGRVEALPTLPSFVYLAGAHELPAGALDLPWASGRDFCVGTFAREQGARVPGRLVASSKSWLCPGGVDRTAAILPWGAAGGSPRLRGGSATPASPAPPPSCRGVRRTTWRGFHRWTHPPASYGTCAKRGTRASRSRSHSTTAC